MNVVNLTPHDVVLYHVEDTITEGKTVMVAAEAPPLVGVYFFVNLPFHRMHMHLHIY